ncbi:TetR/AcrR family transcriptional regulator [Rhodococcus sp. NPDC003348]
MVEGNAAGGVPDELVDAALRAAEETGRDVGAVPLVEIAKRAGISRSTLLRRLGGTRGPLDAAVLASGVDPGGQRPARDRAMEAGAQLIGERGLAALTLEAVASAAHCSVYTLYLAFGNRAGLLQAIFQAYGPTLDLSTDVDPQTDLRAAVGRIYRQMIRQWTREPRIAPAILAEILARPHDPMVAELVEYVMPHSPLNSVLAWLEKLVAAGEIRDLPRVLLVQQMVAPLMVHVLLRPAAESHPALAMPGLNETCAILADNFVRAVGTAR